MGPSGGTLMNGISTVIKETPQSTLAPFPPYEDTDKSAVCNLEEALHQYMTILAF